jgi:hypothetical protein
MNPGDIVVITDALQHDIIGEVKEFIGHSRNAPAVVLTKPCLVGQKPSVNPKVAVLPEDIDIIPVRQKNPLIGDDIILPLDKILTYYYPREWAVNKYKDTVGGLVRPIPIIRPSVP